METKTLVTLAALLWCVVPDRVAWSGPPTEVLTVPGFGQVSLYAPRVALSEVVLFVSGDGGWNLGVIPMAEALRDQVCAPAVTSAFVAVVPGARLFALPKVGHGFGVTRNWETQYLQAYDAIAAHRVSTVALSSAPEVRDLALTEVPVSPPARTDTMAIILTGDGGWADLDTHIAAEMAARGIPSVGWSSLRYYWTPRTPEGAATDLTRIIRHYMSQWSVTRVILVGYSFGADVLPFLINRLPNEVLSHVRSAALLGLSETADFEFHVSDWIGDRGPSPYRTVPEAERLTVPVLCVRGADEDDSACRGLEGAHITSREVGRGHHFSGDYAQLVDVILKTGR